MLEQSGISTCETHLSYLFFTPTRVFKQLKPVTLPFVDFSDPVDRCEAARKEFECNQALSPDVYLGLADVVENGELTDRLIVMDRLPTERALDRRIEEGLRSDELRSVARHVASLHESRPPVSRESAVASSAESIAKNWQDNFDALSSFAGTVIDPEEYRQVIEGASAYIAGRGPLFEHRIEAGWVRDGHGDLRAEHIYCTDDGVKLIDCVAFADNLRISDVLADVAFLAMDLDRLAGVDAAVDLMHAWSEFTNEHHPSSLAHFYVAYRAHVRAKIACLQHSHNAARAVDARRYHSLALRHLNHARQRLVVVGGGPGTGKSTVAEAVAKNLGAAWLRSDEVRKDLTGTGHDDHSFADPGEGIYSAEVTAQTYAELERQANVLLGRGVSVVVDATWASATDRARMRELGATCSATVRELRCHLEPAIAKERIARRMASIYNPSDATPELVDYLEGRFDPWPESITVDTSTAIADTIAEAIEAILPSRHLTPTTGRFRIDRQGWGAVAVSFDPPGRVGRADA